MYWLRFVGGRGNGLEVKGRDALRTYSDAILSSFSEKKIFSRGNGKARFGEGGGRGLLKWLSVYIFEIQNTANNV